MRPLANLTKLESLMLNQNRITDLSPLVNIKSLRVLSLQNNQVVNLRPLAALAQLKELNLGSNKIVGLDGLEAMKTLRTLHLPGNQIAGLQPLFKLVGLRELELVHNGQLHYPEVAQLQEVLPRTQINHNATQTKIQFINKTSEPVVVRWVDFSGELQTYQDNLRPEEGYAQNTYVGHQWVLFNKAGKELGRTFATGKIVSWEIYAKGIKAGPFRKMPTKRREE